MNSWLLIIVFYAALVDMTQTKIPNRAVILLFILGLIQQIPGWPFNYPIPELHDAFAGFLVMLLFSFLQYRLGVFGAGDAKLFAAIGLVTGVSQSFLIFGYALAFVALLGIGKLVITHRLISQLKTWRDVLVVRMSSKSMIRQSSAGDELIAVPMGGAILLAVAMHQLY